jgi:hypothetical protein
MLAVGFAASFGVASAAASGFETVGLVAGSKDMPSEPGKWPEEVQLGGVSGIAINRSGAGGVTPGTLYTAGFEGSQGVHVARYAPDGKFELAWNSAMRCGPQAGEPAHPTCPPVPVGPSGEVDVEVDQATGNVYVFYINAAAGVVRVFSPDLATLIDQFGEKDPSPSGSGTTTPEKVHGSTGVGNIAVNDLGEVYLYDEATGFSSDQYHRLMVFEPQSPGDYANYVYAGQSRDIGAGFPPANGPLSPVLDDEGNIYVAGGTYIQKYDPSQPQAPVCTATPSGGGISSLTVNPETGEVFYYSTLNRKVHQLAPCDAEGKFLELSSFSAVPQRANLEALAFNPTLKCGPSNFKPGVCEQERPAGVLYAGTPEATPPVGSGGEPGQSSLGYILAPPVSHVPVIESESVTRISSTSAMLNATVNPKGAASTYLFQYIADAAYQQNDPAERFAGAIEAPLGGAPLGEGQQGVPVAVAISGLTPAAIYHYRVLATSAEGTAPGEDLFFKTFPPQSGVLADDRAYELVSPTQKNGGEVLPAAPNTASCGNECKPGLAAHRFPVQVSPDGEQILYQGSPFLLAGAASEFDEYLATRTETGWQSTNLSPPLIGDSGGAGFQAFGFDAALTSGYVNATNPGLVPEAPAGYANLFAQPTGDRFDLTPLLRQAPPNRPASGNVGFRLLYAGASRDGSRAFFAANDALTGATPDAPAATDGGAAKFNLYEWSAGQLRLVNVLPSNAATTPGADFGSGKQIAVAQPLADDFSGAISADGSRVFWSSEGGQVYVRENGESTTEIPDHTGSFLSASADGSRVLLDDGVIYDLETEASTDLTAGSGGFKGLLGHGDDLSTVYFIDSAVLTPDPNDQGALAQPGADNLYAWSEGDLAFIATLLPGDNTGLGVWDPAPVRRSAEASPDGRWLAFGSKAELTGVNSIGACEFKPAQQKYVGSVPCEEVFLYDSATDQLRCPSCNPVGAHPLGGSFLRLMMNAEGFLAQPRYLTDSGRLLFDSRDALSALDTNNGVEDVYQYEPQGLGGCTDAGGCVSLISSGRGAFDSNFLTMDPSGDNVFFTTRQRLVPRDTDGLIDLYDARVGGGIAAESEAPQPPCQGEACQPPPVVPPEPQPSTSGFLGEGNLTEPPPTKCPKGKVRKNGKCIKKKKAQKKHHSKKRAKGKRGGSM